MALRRLLVYLPALVVVAIEALVLWPVPLHVGDWFQYWYAGHIVAAGASPLDTSAWRDAIYVYPDVVDDFVVNARRGELFTDPETPILHPPWIYPPWTAALFVPFGILPIRIGVVLLHVALIVAGFASLLWLVSRLGLPPPARALALALAVGLQPFVLATRTGHFTSLLLIGALLVLVALERRTTLPLVAGALILSLKPHLFFLFAPVVLVVLVRRRAWRSIAITSAALVALAGAFYVRYPPPVGDTISAIFSRTTTDDSSTTWSLADQVAPGAGPIIGLVAVLLAAALAWWTVRAAPARWRTAALVAMALCVSLAVAPYLHTYDHMVAVPALLLPLAITVPLPGPHRLAIGAMTLTGALLYPWFAYFTDVQGRQAPSGAVPFIAIALVAASTWLAAHHASAARAT